MTSSRSGWERHGVQALIDAGVLVVNDGYRAKHTELGEVGLPFARAANVNAGLHLEEADHLRWDHIERAGIKRSRPGDVVFTSKGTVGRFAFVQSDTQEFVYSPQLCFWRVLNPSVIAPRFLYYWVHSWECEAQFNAAKGSTDMADYISLRDQRAMSMTCPPVDEQRRIAGVLSSLDDKIESNRRLTRTLEAIAAALFKARFIDLLGYDDFVKSEIGPIPRDWSSTPVGDLARYVNGKAFTKFGNGQGRMVIRIAELRSGPGKSTVYSDHETTPDFMAAPGDILFAWSGSLDVYRWHRPEALINQHIFKVIPKDYPDWFVFYALKHVMPHFQAIAADKATTMGHIKRADLNAFSVATPPTSALREHDAVFAPLFERAFSARREAEALAQVRDQLLPRLLSGQTRIPPEEQPAPEVA